MLTRFIDFLDEQGFSEPELTAGIIIGALYATCIFTLISLT
jgi:hypothetical protein